MDNGREGLITHGPASRRHPTWRMVVIINTAFVCLVLITYLSFLVWIYTNLLVTNGVAEVFSGSCLETSKVATYARLTTCAFAVLLLTVGTHAVQLLLSPTRAEVENVHARDRWLHIGVGGLRNMRWIHKRRLIRAVVLLMTSVLLPFL
jgi:magnesium-transporting ATPase (P-type)